MMDINAILLCDTYKQTHVSMYPKELKKLVSYWVPRKSMFEKPENKKMVWFGIQAFIQEYIVDYFNKNFFCKDKSCIRSSFMKYMNIQLGENSYKIDHVIDLHNLGYLPLEIKALPEGSIVNMGVPCIQLTNTKDEFAWVVQWVECILQAELWKPCNDATIGYMYYRLADYWYKKNVDNEISPRNAFSNFDMRGDDNITASLKTAASWLLFSNKTSTVPALAYIDKYYDADCSYNHIGVGAISTEHSVISANNAYGIDEEMFLKKMLTEIYPNNSFSFLGDTYDYWNMVDNIIPKCKEEILNHNGKLFIRPDSGDTYEIVIKTIQKLWNIFGGTLNKKGYKVIDNHIGVILGDGCTLNQVQKILKKLDSMGFAANNVIFGIGAFCFKAIFEGDKMIVNTRDTYGVAMKATYGVIGDKELKIYKDPKTDSGLKKSHKGLVFVEKVGNEFVFTDNLDEKEYEEYSKTHENAMKTVFMDGFQYGRENYNRIRERIEKQIKEINI